MKLAISNIAWTGEQDEHMYRLMKDMGFTGLEIAPTRVFGDLPYQDLARARAWHDSIADQHGFCIPSMQSIWYGRSERIFGSDDERKRLMDYTREAIRFAEAIGCRNLVFGCPRNRAIPEGCSDSIAVDFFGELGDYAIRHHTVIGMEANPPIYNTNYVNTTLEAIRLIERVGSEGFKLNLDLGTMIYNDEGLDIIASNVNVINHIHISEPFLKPIRKRELHSDLKRCLRDKYEGYYSIEISKEGGLSAVEDSIAYVGGLFNDI